MMSRRMLFWLVAAAPFVAQRSDKLALLWRAYGGSLQRLNLQKLINQGRAGSCAVCRSSYCTNGVLTNQCGWIAG